MAGEKDPLKDYIRLLSHQLKSPINAIESLLNTILEGYTGELDEKTAFILRKAINRSTEARDLIGDLLDYELYAETGAGIQEEIDMARLCGILGSRYMATASENNISFRIGIPDDAAVIVLGDERGLEHALRNLIENAFKYTPEHGSVTLQLSAEEDSKTCRIDIVDSGTGIPEDEIESIFEPFYRSVTHRSGISGTGLGLPIVKRVVEKHGGKLNVGSQVGKGTTFAITLDLVRVENRASDTIVKRRVVIIGGVTAGPKTAARLRRLDEQVDITIVEQGEFLSYSGCGLPGYISGKINSPRALMVTGDSTVRDIDFFESIDNIRVMNHSRALLIDREHRHVEVMDLRTSQKSLVPYDVLVLATGAVPSVPSIPGIDSPGIFTLRSLEDAEKIRAALSTGIARDVYIIGGGIVGISAAEELQDSGARITILEKKEYVMLRMLDRDMALHVQAELSRKGIKIITDCQVNSIESVADSLRIRTSSGSFDSDLIIISAGVAPNVGLAREAGLDIGESGGILVNDLLCTPDPAIYAVGDCAESKHLLTGKHEYWPLGSVSTKMGRIAADNICGNNEEFAGSVGTTLFNIRDLNVARTGLTMRSALKEGFDVESTVVAGNDHAAQSQNGDSVVMLKVIADRRDRRLIGAQCFGKGNVAGKIEIAAMAISNNLTLSQIFAMDLGYSPAHNNPIEITQTACLMLRNKMEGLVSTISAEDLSERQSPVRIISVSPAGTFAQNEIPGAINVPLERIRSEQLPFEKSTPVVLYSRTSAGAYKAYRFLTLHGYTDVSVLEGGYLYWQRL